ncbi:helix-turn-helix domain-containing protein [Eubacterium ventriosum]|uniref:helix-turn-helix domain-containing protein n=1 Tax=Eubacterium ventriosum TaxID=39496 RepID=UPI0035218CE9
MEYKGLEVGNTIKSLRIKKNVSVFELAYRAKISQSHVYQLEEGNNKMSINLLYRLIDALDTDANTILGIKENDENSVDKRLKELNPKLKETLTELFFEDDRWGGEIEVEQNKDYMK